MLTKHENIEYNQVNMSQIVNAENPKQEQKSQVHDHDISTWRFRYFVGEIHGNKKKKSGRHCSRCWL
jgi:hypothetical protein